MELKVEELILGWKKQGKRTKQSYKPVGIIDDVPVGAGVVVVAGSDDKWSRDNYTITTCQFNVTLSQPSCTYTCTVG